MSSGKQDGVPMNVKFTKGKDKDYIEAQRADGTLATTTFPKKGWFPHDAVHLIVERTLRFQHAFWGRIGSGSAPEEIAAIAKAGGHASSSRAIRPADDIVELIQAERLVECFEAEMWGGPSDNATFRGILEAACSQSMLSSPSLRDEQIERIRSELKQCLAQWQILPVGQSLHLTWE
jgi:hypothetical protein